MIQNDFLYSKKLVILVEDNVRRIHNNDNKVYRTDDNLEDRQDKFGAQIDAKYVYRVPQKYFFNLGKINFLTKIHLKIRCTLQTEMRKIFELKKKVNGIGAPDAQIVFARALFIQYSPILLTKNFRKHLEAIMLFSKVLRMGIQETPYQKT